MADGANTVSGLNLLKERYIPAMRNAINNTANVKALVTKQKTKATGRHIVLNLHVSRNSGVGFAGERGKVRAPGNQGFLQVPTPWKKATGSFGISAEFIAATGDSLGAWDQGQRVEMKGLTVDMINLQNKYFLRNGDGALGYTVAGNPTDGTTTITLNDARDAIFFEEGMKIDVVEYTTAAPTVWVKHLTEDRTVTARDIAAGTITVSGAAIALTAATTNRITVAGAIHNGTTDAGIGTAGDVFAYHGLDSQINTTTNFTVNNSNYKSFDGDTVITGAAADNPFIEPLIIRLLDDATTRAGGEVPELFLTGKVNGRQFWREIVARERRQPNTVKLVSGISAMSMQYYGKTIAIMVDRYSKAGISYAWAKKNIVFYEAKPLDWWAPSGNKEQFVPRQTDLEGILYELGELAAQERNQTIRCTNWRQTDLAEA